MTKVRTLRSYTSGKKPPSDAIEGELYVNFPDKMLGVIDPDGNPLDLLPEKSLPSLEYPAVENLYIDGINGDNQTGDGSEAAPWRTVANAIKYLKDTYSEINGYVRLYIGGGGEVMDFGPVSISGFIGAGYISVEGESSALTSIVGIFLDGNKGKSPKVYMNKLTLKPIGTPAISMYYGAYLLIGDKGYVNNDIVIIPSNTDVIMMNYDCQIYTIPASAGVIEYRMTGLGQWGVIAMGQFGGGNKFVDNADWVFTGTPDYWTWAFAFMWDSQYIASGTPTFTGESVNVDGRKFLLYDGSIVKTNNLQGAAPAAPGGFNYFPGLRPGEVDATSFYDGKQGGTRRVLTANEIYHVGATGQDYWAGTDANPFLTIDKAFSHIRKNLDLNGFDVSVIIGDGAFVGAKISGTVGSGRILIYGAGSNLTTINPMPANSRACIEFGGPSDGSKVSFYLNAVTINMSNSYNGIYARDNYRIYLMNTSWKSDIVFIPSPTQTYSLIYISRVNDLSLSSGIDGTYEIRAGGGTLDAIIEANNSNVYDDGKYTFTGVLLLAAFIKMKMYSHIMRSAGSIIGDITGVSKQYSLSYYTSMQINNNAFYSGPAGTADVSCMVQGVMGTTAFDSTIIIEHDKSEDYILLPDESSSQYPTPDEYAERMVTAAAKEKENDR